MQELEKVLNSMIKKWWKPWGKEYTAIDIIQDGREECLMFWDVPKRQMQAYTFRSLVSIEIGLWQFVCKNKLNKKTDNFWENVSKTSTNIWWFPHNHQYRLLESALIPEEDLAKFLIDNIIITWNSK